MGPGVIDMLAAEGHFAEHIAPVWRALPEGARGRALVAGELVERAASLGIIAEPMDAVRLRLSSRPPKAQGGDGPTALVASIGDIKLARRLGYRRFVLMQHGAGQSYGGERGSASRHPSYAGGADNDDVGLFLVPNEHSAERWRRAYPPASVVVVGCPKLDALPAREPGPPTIALAWHWPLNLVPETLPATEFLRALPALAERYRVIGHGHPRWAAYGARIQRVCEKGKIEYVADFEDVCRRADLLAFDNTSAGFEFAATGRPVVVMNAAGYRRKVHHGLRFWNAANVGVQVDNPALLPAAIVRALENRPEDVAARETALAVVYSDRRPGAALRAATAVTEWLGVAEAVAA